MADIGIGAVQFGLDYGISNKLGKPCQREVEEIVDFAKCNRISLFDTAPAYGASERVLGQVLGDYGKIVTKTPSIAGDAVSSSDVKRVVKVFHESLVKLGRDRVYGLLVHSANSLIKPGCELLYSELSRLKNEGKVDKIGVSIYSAEQLDSIINRFDVDVVQLPVNVLDQRLLNSGHLDRLKDKGVEVHVRSVFLQGLLLMNPSEMPKYFGQFEDELTRYFDRIRELGLTMLEAALGFVLSLPQVDHVLVGVDTAKQLHQIVDASKASVEPNLFRDIAVVDVNLLNPSLWKQ